MLLHRPVYFHEFQVLRDNYRFRCISIAPNTKAQLNNTQAEPHGHVNDSNNPARA